MNRLLLLAGLVYLFVLAALTMRQGDFLALSIPLLGYLAAAFIYGPSELRLTATRSVGSAPTPQRASVTVKVTVKNEGPALEQVLVEDMVPSALRLLTGETQVVSSLPAGGSIELQYTVSAKRGYHDLDRVCVTANEHLGLLRRRTTLSVPAHVSVLPEVLGLRRLHIHPLRTRAQAGPIPARVGGSGVVFYGVREYQMGDPRRWINWRISARHPRSIFTNEFEQERIADVGLILDARARSDVRLPEDSLFEHAVRATASLAHAFLSDGNRVGLLVYGRFLDWTFPGYGRVQRERIMRTLTRAEPGESRIFEDFDYLPTRFFPAQSQIVLISPLCNDDLPMLVRLRARGYQILAIRPNPVEFELKALEPKPAVELAARIIRAERELLRRKLLQAGVQVVDWEVDRPFDQVIHASLGRMPHWFNPAGIGL